MTCTTGLPTVHILVATTRCQYWWTLGPQMSKFEQVSGNDHQMPVVEGGVGQMPVASFVDGNNIERIAQIVYQQENIPV